MLFAKAKQKIKFFLPRPLFRIIFSISQFFTKNIQNHAIYIEYVSGKNGIEIGGPSPLFKNALPVYKEINNLDNVNFSKSTIWEGDIQTGQNFKFFKNKKGTQFILDSTNLSQIKDASYDFLLSSNCLEHIANPLKALTEWNRVIKPKGVLILVLPNKKTNFDRNRPTTSFNHILEDFHNNTTEHDLTHLDEILKLHDLSMNLESGDIENFKKISLNNFNTRILHHHVFDFRLMTSMLEFTGFKIIEKTETNRDFYMLAIKNN